MITMKKFYRIIKTSFTTGEQKIYATPNCKNDLLLTLEKVAKLPQSNPTHYYRCEEYNIR